MNSSHPGQVDFPSEQVLLQSGKLSVNCISLKEQTCPGQAKFERHLSQEQDGIQVYFKT